MASNEDKTIVAAFGGSPVARHTQTKVQPLPGLQSSVQFAPFQVTISTKELTQPVTARVNKLLILYASYGDGHIQVSRALKEQLEARGCGVVLVDLFAEAHPRLNALTKYIYIKSYSLFPGLYGWSYYRTREMGSDTAFSAWFHRWGMSKLKEIIGRERPDGVVNTFPMLAMPELRKKTGMPTPVFTVLTDYTLHWRWIHPYVDKYYVATDDLRRELANAGVSEYDILATGIPLKAAFRRLLRTPALYEAYGLDPGKRTLLIMAGSYGVMQGLKDVCESLAAIAGVQLLVVCGKNETLRAAMAAAAERYSNIRVFGFIQPMHEPMSLADTMVTKPGGITLTESIQCGLPLVLFRPVPGQERDNADYLAAKGAAFIADDSSSLVRRIRVLLEDDGQREAMKRCMEMLRKLQSAEAVANDIVESLESFQAETVVPAERRRVSSEFIS